ncbi:NUDIX hydrolase [Patulibacter minatonensis]|uniref:NUDIX hydrolase n=1 Tax=Patulibacter minatonensis TaxID=298163 RepID=UPI0004B7FCD3|nr:NUDIX domain-containing protein [Patulibacter minatonensis]
MTVDADTGGESRVRPATPDVPGAQGSAPPPPGTWSAQNSAGYPSPAGLTADVVVLTVRDGAVRVLALTTDDGRVALPGGFVGAGEDPADTAARKLTEKTGLRDLYLEQLGAFAAPGRDPRGWIPTVAHLALVPADTTPGDPAAAWIDARAAHDWAFDHREILAAALERVEGKLWWSNVCVGVLPGDFALADARAVYDAVARTTYDPGTFARDLRATGLIEPTGEERRAGKGRPAALYRFASREPAWGAGRRKRVKA